MTINKFLEKADGFYGKKLRITCTDGEIIYGTFATYTSEFENEPDGESITIDLAQNKEYISEPMEIYTEEIKNVDVID